MANYDSIFISNDFSVKNEEAFRRWASTLEGVEVECRADGADGSFFTLKGECGLPNTIENGDGEVVDIEFSGELAKHLAQRSIAILMEVGNERLRSLHGYAVAIHPNGETVEIGLGDIYRQATEAFIGCDIKEVF